MASSKSRAKKGKAPKSKSKAKASSRLAAPAVTKEDEAQWKAESDMRTLREAEVIRSDQARLKAAKNMVKEEVAALKKI